MITEHIKAHVDQALAARAEWIEDVLAGLLINGVRENEIAVVEHDNRTVVIVRGKALYELSVNFITRA